MFVRFAVFVALLCPLALPGHASIIDFIGTGVPNVTAVPDGYAGFDWNAVLYLDATLQPSVSGYGKLATSEGDPNIALITENSIGSFSRAGDFILQSINIAPGWNDGVNVQLGGWLNGVQLYTSNLTLSVSNAPTTVQPGWGAVDAVTIVTTSHGTPALPEFSSAAHLGIGNITYSDVPEPGTLLGMGVGLLALSLYARRRRRAE